MKNNIEKTQRYSDLVTSAKAGDVYRNSPLHTQHWHIKTQLSELSSLPVVSTMFDIPMISRYKDHTAGHVADTLKKVASLLDKIDTKYPMSARDRRKLGTLLPKAIAAAKGARYGNSRYISQIDSLIEKVNKLNSKGLDNALLKSEVINSLWIAYGKAERGLDDAHWSKSDIPQGDFIIGSTGFKTAYQSWVYYEVKKVRPCLSVMPKLIAGRDKQKLALSLARRFDNITSGELQPDLSTNPVAMSAVFKAFKPTKIKTRKLKPISTSKPCWYGPKCVFPAKSSWYAIDKRYTGDTVDYDKASKLLDLPTIAESIQQVSYTADQRNKFDHKLKLENILFKARIAGKWSLVTRIKRKLA